MTTEPAAPAPARPTAAVTRHVVAVSGSLALAWLAVDALAALASLSGPLGRLSATVLPAGVTPFIWSWPLPWALLFCVAGAVAVGATHAAILAVTGSATTATTSRLWLAAVGAGAIVGMAIDGVLVFGSVFTDGFVMWALDLGSRAAIGAYWGLLYGWVPALVGARFVRADAALVRADAASARLDATSVPTGAHRAWVVLAAVAALLVVMAVRVAGDDAAQVAVREQAVAEAAEPAQPDGAAAPDPAAAGVAVAERAEGPGSTGADACTPDRATVLLGGADAATGHRGQVIRVSNFSDESCVIEGYPDIAFSDQNGHVLDVTIEHGSSFMAADPGPSRVEVPAGGTAVAVIGWDAASTHGALVARLLHMAPLAGDLRSAWQIQADIVAGSTVEVTAWQAESPTSPYP